MLAPRQIAVRALRCLRHAAAFAVLALAGATTMAPAAHAQRKPGPEFTRQGLLLLTFATPPGVDRKLGREAGDAVRGRLGRHTDEREVQILGGGEVRRRLEAAGFTADDTWEPDALASLARGTRADEYVVGAVSRSGEGVRIEGELRLSRDRWTRQRLPASVAPTLDAAADAMARVIAATRVQLVHQRRCENALRDGQVARAVEAARAGVAAAPAGAYVRACQVLALGAAGAPPAERLAAARELLALDSTSRQGLEGAARAHDQLRQRQPAAAMWLRVLATDTSDVDLISRVVYALMEGGNAPLAEPAIVQAAKRFPDELPLQRLRWLVALENRSWALATESGELLLEKDGAAVGDSTFLLKLADAHRAAGNPLRAVELAARGAARFPTDARLYAMYAQLVVAERDTVLGRGLARFPKSAALHLLAAREAKARGQAEVALAATRRAVELDSLLPQGRLTVAQAEFELGRPDSAYAMLTRALAAGDDTATVAQFALAKGNALFRAANQTRGRDDFARALRWFALADSARRTPQSRFLVGTTALSLAQAALNGIAAAPSPAAGCELARQGNQALGTARAGLTDGAAVSAETAQQYLGFVAQLAPYAEKAVAGCAPAPPSATATTQAGSAAAP